ncbi:MAG: hypothetical protein PHF76_11430 [Bacteroidales bacterium]|nr:hypothetical protein [Bacteroidales bacterium]
MNVTELVEQILDQTTKKNQIERTLKGLKAQFKTYATQRGLSTISGGGKWYNRSWVPKQELNEERITSLFQTKNLDVDGGKSMKWDEQKLLALVTLGVLTDEELSSCYDDKGYEVWRFADETIE